MPIENCPERVRDPEWRGREEGRLHDGTYVQVPWALENWRWTCQQPEHGTWPESSRFAHVSTTDPTMVAFTASEEHGELDRQTRMKPGKYLKRFYGHVLSDQEIADWAARFGAENAPRTLYFAVTADDIEHVYTHGPNSCMSKGAYYFDSSEHPVRVYAAGDLQVAYVTRNNTDDEDDEITARALCWPERKVYGMVYGDAARLVPLLKAAGYTAGRLTGARLLRIEEDDGFICPYIDGDRSVSDEGDHLVIGGNIEVTETEGLIRTGTYCPVVKTISPTRSSLGLRMLRNAGVHTASRIRGFVRTATSGTRMLPLTSPSHLATASMKTTLSATGRARRLVTGIPMMMKSRYRPSTATASK